MTLSQPELRTDRLLLRPFGVGDAPAVRALAVDPDVAAHTLDLPHPYRLQHARDWIASHRGQLERGAAATCAITRLRDSLLIGAALLVVDRPRDAAEIGFWIGKPFRGTGYATEAVGALVHWGFEEAGLRRIHGAHAVRNPASGAVLRNVGMRYEGRGRMMNGGEEVEMERYGLPHPAACATPTAGAGGRLSPPRGLLPSPATGPRPASVIRTSPARGT
jgi:[ribosomal protein S5]-alanine N-acetyltransferase